LTTRRSLALADSAARCNAAVLVVAALNACSGGSSDRDAGATARPGSGGAGARAGEGSGGTVTTGADAAIATIGADASVRCVYPFEPTYEACLAAVPLTPDAPLTMQDTANGALGDCAAHASGPGGRNLYYTLTLPPDRYMRVVAAPVVHTEDAVLRVLAHCHAPLAQSGARGGRTSDGRAVVCLRNESAVEREVIIAVGRYSGEANDLTLVFDLSVGTPPSGGCEAW